MLFIILDILSFEHYKERDFLCFSQLNTEIHFLSNE